ncbi:methyltransferase protein [Rutstroemia sp. NJR-2017a BVV2]|nr:methyltransferase protein [Rutstroemia sp. NJR-2017a BVV2]
MPLTIIGGKEVKEQSRLNKILSLVAAAVPMPSASPSLVPTDPATSQRLLDQHHVVIDALGGKLVLAPINLTQPNLRILDSATADGHWLQELREQCGSSKNNTYVGTDINSKILPTSFPPDFDFYLHNFGTAWPSKAHASFDLAHQRLSLPGAVPYSLPQAVRNILELVKPGGWIQLVEAEQIAPNSGPVFLEFLELVRELEESGAVDIQEISVDMILGPSNEKIELVEKGASSTAGAMHGLVMHAKAMNLRTSLSNIQLDTLADRLYAELIETGAHYPLRAVWGRKKPVGDA